jgi:hypothetical protein
MSFTTLMWLRKGWCVVLVAADAASLPWRRPNRERAGLHARNRHQRGRLWPGSYPARPSKFEGQRIKLHSPIEIYGISCPGHRSVTSAAKGDRMAESGTKRQSAAAPTHGRFQSEADICRRAGRSASGADDPKRRLAGSQSRTALGPDLMPPHPLSLSSG